MKVKVDVTSFKSINDEFKSIIKNTPFEQSSKDDKIHNILRYVTAIKHKSLEYIKDTSILEEIDFYFYDVAERLCGIHIKDYVDDDLYNHIAMVVKIGRDKNNLS